MIPVRGAVASLILSLTALSSAADLYYLQGNDIRRYDTATNTSSAPFGAAYGVNGPAGGAGTSGLAVGPDGTVYAEAQVGGTFGQHLLQRFEGSTGAYLGGYAHPSAYNAAMDFGPDGNLYTAALGGDFSTGMYINGLKRVNPVTGASLGNLIEPGASSPLISIPSPMWLPNGDLLATHGDSRTIKRFNSTTGAYSGVFATVDPARWMGVMAYAGGIVYLGSSDESQILKFRESDGAYLGAHLIGPARGTIGQFYIVEGEIFVAQQNLNTFEQLINRYDLQTGAYLSTLNTGGSVTNFAMARTYNAVPEPMSVFALGFSAVLLCRRRRK